jgi:hypothetical protein
MRKGLLQEGHRSSQIRVERQMARVQGFPVGCRDLRMGLGAEVRSLPQYDERYGVLLVGLLAHSIVVEVRVCIRVREGKYRSRITHPELISSNSWAFCGLSYESSGPSSIVNPFLQKVITLTAVSISRSAGAFGSGTIAAGVSSSPRRFPAPWKGPERESSSSTLRRDPLYSGPRKYEQRARSSQQILTHSAARLSISCMCCVCACACAGN